MVFLIASISTLHKYIGDFLCFPAILSKFLLRLAILSDRAIIHRRTLSVKVIYCLFTKLKKLVKRTLPGKYKSLKLQEALKIKEAN